MSSPEVTRETAKPRAIDVSRVDDEQVTIESERSRHIGYVYVGVVGTFVGVAWAYVVVEELDPSGRCPGPAKCFWLVGVLVLCVVAGLFVLPYIALQGVLRLRAADLGAPLLTRHGFVASITQNLQRMVTDTTTMTWAVLNATVIYYVLGQASEDLVPPSQGGQLARGQTHFDEKIVLLLLILCATATTIYFTLASHALRKLPSETRPYWVEVWLLLSRAPVFPGAYSISILLGLIFFAPYQLGFIRRRILLLAIVLVRAISFWLVARWVSRILPHVSSDPSVATAEASQSLSKSAQYLASTAAGIVACIGVNDFVVSFAQLYLSTWQEVAFLLAGWAPFVLMVAMLRSRTRLARAQHESATLSNLGICETFWVRLHPNDTAFVDVAEFWLVSFAFWTPGKIILGAIWGFVAYNPQHKNDFTFGLLMIVRLLWLLTVASVVTLLFAVLTSGILLLAEVAKARRTSISS